MAISQRGGNEAIHRNRGGGFVLFEIKSTFPHEHIHVSHAVVGIEVVHIAEIEIHQPGVEGQPVAFVLGVVAIRQSGIEGVVVALGINRPLQSGFLLEKDLTITVKGLRRSRRTGHTGVVVHYLPRSEGRVHIAVTGGVAEFFLLLLYDLFGYFLCPDRLGLIHPEPTVLELVVRRADDMIELEVFIGRSDVGKLGIGPIDIAERVAEVIGDPLRALVAALERSCFRAESE